MPNYKNMAPEGMMTIQEAARRLWQEHQTGALPDSVASTLRAACMRSELVSVAIPRNRWYIRRFVRYADVKTFWATKNQKKK